MSKAFLREDDLNTDDLPPPPATVLPPGAKNYITPAGLERLKGDLEDFTRRRSALVAQANDPEAKRRGKILEQRIRYLQQSLRSAEVVTGPAGPADVVRFGTTVTVRDDRNVESRYRIVGVDETDLTRGDISWQSPLAQALLNARPGERIRFKAPRGFIELEILRIAYE
jgi:transcription elongation factor GreB